MALDPTELSSCGIYEHPSTSKDYPYKVLCKLCKKLIKSFRMRFVYKHVMDGDPDPEVLREFCFKMIRENFAVVKIEMATKSITRTVKDQRYNLVSKISSLGGTLGLFVGMSLITAAEFIMWPMEILFKRVMFKKR